MMERELLKKIDFLVGDEQTLNNVMKTSACPSFDERVISFLTDLSKELMQDKANKIYPDVMTFAFWIREASLNKLKERFSPNGVCLGRGVAFHIAPSNVPVNFAYSLVAGLITGNINIVRVPSKDFPQVKIIAAAINHVLAKHAFLGNYIILLRYGHEKSVNDALSAVADTRIIWGGDETISALRKSILPPRSTEILFADRYSLAMIDAEAYLAMPDKERLAEGVYNDTFLTDQNACTSPKIIIWMGDKKKEAKVLFWRLFHDLVAKRYHLQDIQGVNKLTAAHMAAVAIDGVTIEPAEDNLITRLTLSSLSADVIDYMNNSGFFFEYDCYDMQELWPMVDDKRCQTVALLGDDSLVLPLIERGCKGIDRVVPIGHTMDFDLLWDGYDLPRMLTRQVFVG